MSEHEMSAAEYRMMIDPANEKVFTRLVMRVAQEHQWLIYHTHDSRRSPAGFPDLVLVNPDFGGAVFAELKMPGKYPSPAQRVWLTTLLTSGQRVYLWYPNDYAEILDVLRGGQPDGYEAVVRRKRLRNRIGSQRATNRSSR